jgi:hypothetical protein
MPDGVYVTSADGEPTFVRAPGLSDDYVRQIVETTANRVVRLLQRRGLLEEDTVDPLWEEGAPAGHDHGCFGPGAGGHRRPCRATRAAPADRSGRGGEKWPVVLFLPWVFPACGHLCGSLGPGPAGKAVPVCIARDNNNCLERYRV